MSSDPNDQSDATTWLWIGGIALLFFFPILLIPVGLFFLFKWWVEDEKSKHEEKATTKSERVSRRKREIEPSSPTEFQSAVSVANKWSEKAQSQFKNSISERGWVTLDLAGNLDAEKKKRAVTLLSAPENSKMKSALSGSDAKNVEVFLDSADRLRERINKKVLEK